MIVKFLGILDILSGGVFLLSGIIRNFPEEMVLFCGIYILIKGLIFISNFNINSILDVAIGLVMILSGYIELGLFITIIASIFLIQKGVSSIIDF